MKILLYHLDGRMPNLALMRLAAHHRQRGDLVELRRGGSLGSVAPDLFDKPDQVYASLIFERTRPVAEHLLQTYPNAIVGGTGWDLTTTLEQHQVGTDLDYTIYPKWTASIGFTQRGCRLKCGFCVVPRKEGKIKIEQSIGELWRGDPWPRDLVLLDNDFFGQPGWKDRIEEIRKGGFRVNFNQGINARFLTAETAAAVASVPYMDSRFTRRCIYTAWDNARDERRLFKGLQHLVDAGVKARDIMVYILLGYFEWSALLDWEIRRIALRKFGAVPYPMPYIRDRRSVGYQRWVVGAYDKRIPWVDWEAAGYRPEKLDRSKR